MNRKAGVISLLLLLCACGTRHYYGRGLVLEVSSQSRTVTVSHESIPGFMDAMIMPFAVRYPALVAKLQPGTPIYFRLVVNKQRSYLDYMRVLAQPPETFKEPRRPASGAIALGQLVPDFRLMNEDGRTVELSDFRGKVVAITFIYTRCPLPDYCPRMTANFLSLSKRFGARLGEDLIFLTITFDPAFDTAEVLKGYAQSYGADSRGWHFLTGSMNEIEQVCDHFGIQFWADEGAITHNLQTGLIDRQGRLAANVGGKEYSSQQLGDLIERLLNTP